MTLPDQVTGKCIGFVQWRLVGWRAGSRRQAVCEITVLGGCLRYFQGK